MNKTKKMLIGLMLCGAIAMAGSAATTLRVESAQAAETNAATTETSLTGLEWKNNGFCFTLSNNDYQAISGNGMPGEKKSEFNYLSNIVVYKGEDTSATLGEIVGGDTYYNMWSAQNTYTVQLSEAWREGITKVVVPEGTEFPSVAYTGYTPWTADNSASFVAPTTDVKTSFVTSESVTYTYNGTAWAASIELKKEDAAISKVQLRGKYRILFFLSANDYASVGGTTVATSFADCNTLEKIQIYVGDTCVSLGEAFAEPGNGVDMNVYFNVWNETGSISFPLKSAMYTSNTVTKVVIPAGTQFVSASGKTAYTTTKDFIFINKSPAESDSMDWERQIVFTEEETTASVFAYDNGRLGFSLSENDFPPTHDKEGNPINDNANIDVEASKLNSLNFLNTVKVNGVALGTLSDVSYFNMWTRPNSFYIPLAEPKEGTVVEIPAGTQFPSYAYVSGTNEVCYTTKTDATYVLLDGEWRKTCNVTFDGGEAKTAYVGVKLPADIIPENPTRETTETTVYTFDGWYVGDTKFNPETDVVTGDMALVAKFNESARKYRVTYNKEDGTEYQTVEVANGETLTLIQVPGKEGYTGVWTGETFDEMPTKDIVYTASYTINEYTVTFKADGETVGTAKYTVENKTITEPAVPEKEGFTGAWEVYELTTGDITVNAVYTAIPDDSSSSSEDVSSPDDSSSSEDVSSPDDSSSSEDVSSPDDSSSSEDVSSPEDSSSSDGVTSSETSSSSEDDKKKGCSSSASVLGVSGAFAAVGIAMAIRKRKENKDK